MPLLSLTAYNCRVSSGEGILYFMAMSRNFNRKQKQSLFLIADGTCQICGESLKDDWEADHKKSYSRGGKTDLINGQALCRKCNRIKGNKEMFEPRKWQMEFIETYLAKNLKDFLLVATPGAGKTKATLYLFKDQLSGATNQIVIVVPTEQLKRQWAKVALEDFGIQLQPYWGGGRIKQGYKGICLTYAQVSTTIWALDWLCQQSPTFVIFDEIHHAGESLAWGNGIKEAFRHAALRLAESGTPFRSDNNKIPFVTYNPNGESRADFSYNYRNAIVDSVCRNVSFPAFDGMASWFDGEDVIESNSFDEALDNPKHESQRLRSALDTGNTFIVSMLKEAVKLLDDIRKEDLTAGGLIVTIDTRHADAIGRLMREITGEEPTVVHSSDPSGENSSYLIDNFDKDTGKKWIIAVKMISEGVDIKRLRVGVYATNVVTELSFRQIVGRVVRRQGEGDQWAHFFVPKDGRLVEFTERIKEERNHATNGDSREIERNGNGDHVRQGSDFLPVAATRNPDNDIVVAEGETFIQSQIDRAIGLCQSVGIQATPTQAALLLRKIEGPQDQQKVISIPAESPLWVKEKGLRRVVNDRAYAVACRIKERCSTSKTAGEIVRKIHFRWTQLGHHKQEDANTEELELKLKWLSSIEDEHWRFI